MLTPYPSWVLVLGGTLAALSVVPIPIVFLLRRFQCVRLDTDINKGVIRRNETTISTKQMMTDVDEYLDVPIEENDDEDETHLEITAGTRKFRIDLNPEDDP